MASEESKVISSENSTEVLTAYNKIPYPIISAETDSSSLMDELTQICQLYDIYKKGCKFTSEGTNGDYVPATLKYKMAASLVNKEARFLFAEAPDIVIEPRGDIGTATEQLKEQISEISSIVESILSKNNFEDKLLKAAKDCFIGKRVACLVNFNEEDGITVNFLKSTDFVYETKQSNQQVVTKFVAFSVLNNVKAAKDKRIFKKKYTLEQTDANSVVYLEEVLYDGAGTLLEVVTEKQPTMLKTIPAFIFINDGLTGEVEGESEIELLQEHEYWYSKMSNADLDAGRKSMNPTKFLVDIDSQSTKNLSTAAGALWDLGSDQQLEKPSPKIGILEPAMNYSNPLSVSLERIKKSGYDLLDMPDVESIQATITSGKALRVIYWSLLVRCKEKMKMWGPQLREMVDCIIQGALVYPNCLKVHTDTQMAPVAYEIKILQNAPLPEDEAEEKSSDIIEVEAGVMSRKSYMKKWRQLTDKEAEGELAQIAKEKQLLESSSFESPSIIPDDDMDDEESYT